MARDTEKTNFFKERRERLGKTKSQIAAEVNMTKAAVGYWEAGAAIPRFKLCSVLAKAYGVSESRMRTVLTSLHMGRGASAVTS